MLTFDERNQVNILFDLHYKYLLALILFLIGMLQNIQQETHVNIKDNFLKGKAAFGFQQLILFFIP